MKTFAHFAQRACALIMALVAIGATAQTVPSQFAVSTVANVGSPTALAFTPDNRLLITTQGGTLRIVKNGALLATPAITFNQTSLGEDPMICVQSERGLLGVAVDPQFATNNFIYLFYTARNGSTCQTGTYGTSANYEASLRPVNRVSRFTLASNDIVDPNSETILVDNMPSPGANHNGGDLHFGKDGYLYISIGDGGSDYAGDSGSGGGNNAARDTHVLTGKILRVTNTGGIPPDNPFLGANSAACANRGATTPGNHCQETFAWGLRNPFRFAMDPNATGTRFYINDVGQGLWEEVNDALKGADYGWNACEGRHNNGGTGACTNAPAGSTLPVYEYAHGINGVPGTALNSCNSITGGAFVPNGLWPGFDNRYLISDFVCDGIWSIATSGTPTAPVASGITFATNAGAPAAMTFGPYGSGKALYVAAYDGTVKAVYFKSAALDIDGNGTVDAATDGVLLVRYLFGYRGAALIANALGPGATRGEAQIEAYLASKTAGATPPFKVAAGASTMTATADGLLIMRHLQGLSGAALIAGIPLAAPLDTAAEISQYLTTLLP